MSIPKVIHYCWIGGNPKPKSVEKCIESWKKHCPDYEIREWNESNLNIDLNEYTRQAYDMKKWAFATDVLRLWIIYNRGSIYMDTDVTLLKSLDPFLQHEAFAAFENEKYVATGLALGAVKGHPTILKNLRRYDDARFIKDDGNLNLKPCTNYTYDILQPEGLLPDNGSIQTVAGMTIYPVDYFCPKDFRTGILKITDRTVAIHNFDATWHSPADAKRWRKKRRRAKLKHLIIKIIGNRLYEKLRGR